MHWQKVFANDTTDNTQNIQTDHTVAQYIKKKNQTPQSENGQETEIDISSEKIYRWPRGTWERGSILLVIRKMKIKTTMASHWSEWPSSKSLQIINVGEGIERRQPLYTVC